MRAYNDVKVEPNKGREILPAGGYVAKVQQAVVENTDYGEKLVIYFDIAEGPHAGFFRNDYQVQTQEDKKWRGVYRMYLPKDDGSEKDGWSKRTLGGVIWAFENSNNGYHWGWDENTLKGLSVGVLFRNKEWEMNGNTGWTTECCKLIDSDSVRQGKFKMPKDKPLDRGSTYQNKANGLLDDDGDLPWN